MEHTPPPVDLKKSPEDLRRELHAMIDMIQDPDGLRALLELAWFAVPEAATPHTTERDDAPSAP